MNGVGGLKRGGDPHDSTGGKPAGIGDDLVGRTIAEKGDSVGKMAPCLAVPPTPRVTVRASVLIAVTCNCSPLTGLRMMSQTWRRTPVPAATLIVVTLLL